MAGFNIMNSKSYKNMVEKLNKAKVLVIGDLMLDKFTYGSVVRISPEAPVPVLHVSNEDIFLGGAGNVARNIASVLGTKSDGLVGLLGIIGSDKSAGYIKNAMREYSIDTKNLIVDNTHPTITKTRIVAGSQQIVRIDEEDLSPFRANIYKEIEEVIAAIIDNYNVVIISDYAKGVINKEIASYVINICNKKKIKVLVDPAIKHFSYYENASLMTPNLKEAIEGNNSSMISYEFDEKKINALGENIKNKLKLENLMITLGANGMALFSDNIKTENKKPYIIDTKAKSVFDVSGAGDTVIAITAMCLSVGLSFLDSSYIANAAAGIVVGKRGTSTITLEELKNAL